MALETGDIFPFSSGTSSLGVEQINGVEGGFTTEIRPFNHIHFNSGVIHDVLHGGSGVMRYSMGRSIDPGLAQIAPGGKQNAIEISEDGGLTYKLRLGGAPATANDPNGFGLIDTGQNAALFIRASGMDFISGKTIYIRTLPRVAANIECRIELASNDGISILSFLDDINLTTEEGTIRSSSTAGNIELDSNPDLNGIGGQIQLDAFSQSGRLEFRFGPHQGWYSKLTHSSAGGPFNDGYWPLPHSGQIAQMIAQGAGGTLQTAYEGGPRIDCTVAEGGPVQINGNGTYGLFLRTQTALFDRHPHILVSGTVQLIDQGDIEGSLYLIRHTIGKNEDEDRLGLTLSGKDGADAESLGPSTLFFNTGSGVVNLSVGSGIASFVNLGTSSSIDSTGLNVNIAAGGQLIPDSFYNAVGSSGIKINVPGLYRVQYSIFAEKNTGSLQQTMRARAIVNDQWGRTFTIIGGESYATLRDNNAHSRNTANGGCMTDLNTNDVINIAVNTTEAPPAGNSIRIPARACSVILEYIGPQRGLSTQLAV